MKKLSKEDQKFLLCFIEVGIKDAHFNATRYHTEEYYNKTAQLQRIYNILSYDPNDFNMEGGRLDR